jgi:hypothetical protein
MEFGSPGNWQDHALAPSHGMRWVALQESDVLGDTPTRSGHIQER